MQPPAATAGPVVLVTPVSRVAMVEMAVTLVTPELAVWRDPALAAPA